MTSEFIDTQIRCYATHFKCFANVFLRCISRQYVKLQMCLRKRVFHKHLRLLANMFDICVKVLTVHGNSEMGMFVKVIEFSRNGQNVRDMSCMFARSPDFLCNSKIFKTNAGAFASMPEFSRDFQKVRGSSRSFET